jgi:hypothetical protein
MLLNMLELAAAIIAGLDDPRLSARLFGAAGAVRREADMPLTDTESVLIEVLLAPARAALTPQEWDAEEATGKALKGSEARALLLSLAD